jgi:DNA primase
MAEFRFLSNPADFTEEIEAVLSMMPEIPEEVRQAVRQAVKEENYSYLGTFVFDYLGDRDHVFTPEEVEKFIEDRSALLRETELRRRLRNLRQSFASKFRASPLAVPAFHGPVSSE